MPEDPTPASTVARALLASFVRHGLGIIGTALVTRGAIDQGAVDGVIPTAVEIVVGAVMTGAAVLWGQARAYLSHTRWAAAWRALQGGDSGAKNV